MLLPSVLYLLLLSACGPAKGTLVYFGLYSERQAPEALARQLEPYDAWFLPDGAGTGYPGVLMVPGCAGTQAFHREWGRWFALNGMVALLMDSFQVRGIDSASELEAVCEGEHLWGFERAGDVLVTLPRLRSHPRVDPDRLHLIGWSHGGWAVLDAVALGARPERLPMLSRPIIDSLRGVRAAAVLYPYCGFGNHVQRYGWDSSIRGLLVVADRDRNIEPGPCLELADKLLSDQKPVQLLRVDADHWFDNPEGADIVPHEFDAGATQRVRESLTQLFGETK